MTKWTMILDASTTLQYAAIQRQKTFIIQSYVSDFRYGLALP